MELKDYHGMFTEELHEYIDSLESQLKAKDERIAELETLILITQGKVELIKSYAQTGTYLNESLHNICVVADEILTTKEQGEG